MVYQNQDHYKSQDHLRHDLLVSAGMYDIRHTVWGEEMKVPRSLNFATMSEGEFEKVYSAVVDEVVSHFNFDNELIKENAERWF